MMARVIIDNMIEEDEEIWTTFFSLAMSVLGNCVKPSRTQIQIQAFFKTYQQIEDIATYTQLCDDS
jgi:hypothetical protein